MELVAGCYEQVLFGFAVHREPEASGALEGIVFNRELPGFFSIGGIRPWLTDCGPSLCFWSTVTDVTVVLTVGFPLAQQWTPVADFTHHAHTASLSAVAVSSRFVVTGSRDETIHIYDMKTKTEHGALVHHSGTITCLKFYGNRHLISGAEDGLICIWDTKKWECLKSIRAHRGHVTFLSIHPSGKLALSVGTDKTLRTWNLVDGRSAFIKNIKQNAHIVEWSPKGEKYVVVTGNKVDIYLLDTASVSGTLTNEKRVSSVAFLSESVLAVAGDEEVVRLFDCDSLLCLCEFRAHENRVKDMLSFEVPEHRVMVTASSDGFLRMWKLSHDKAVPPSLLCEVNTKARLTCLGVWLDRQTNTKKSLPPAAEPCPVNKEQSRSPQKESGGEVQKEEKLSECNAERGGLPGESREPERERPVAPRKRKGDLPGEGGKRKRERSLVAPGNTKGGLSGEGSEPKREKSLIVPRKRKGGLSGEGSEPERERSLVAPKKRKGGLPGQSDEPERRSSLMAPKKRKGGLPGEGSEPERERSLQAPKKKKIAKMLEKKKKKKKIQIM